MQDMLHQNLNDPLKKSHLRQGLNVDISIQPFQFIKYIVFKSPKLKCYTLWFNWVDNDIHDNDIIFNLFSKSMWENWEEESSCQIHELL